MPIVEPHKKLSRFVRESDLERVRKDAKEMKELCWKQDSFQNKMVAYAIAHPQITQDDPLSFFVFPSGDIVINPVIINKTRHPVKKSEGCMSFHEGGGQFPVQRSHKIEIQYQEIDENGLTEPRREHLSGLQAQIIQHEVDHFNGVYVFPV